MHGRSATIRRVAHDRTLRRVAFAFALFSLAESATWLAMLVFAFDRGGTNEAGLVSVLALGCAVVVAPFAAYAGDRYAAHRAMVIGFLCQVVALGVGAIGMANDHAAIAYAGSIALAGAVTFIRPIVSSLLPGVTHRPVDLVAANAVMSALGNVGIFVGPLLAALLLAASGPAAVFAGFAGLTAVAAIATAGIRLEDSSLHRVAMTAPILRTRVLGGIVAFGREPTLRLLVLIMSMSAFSAGAIDVLIVTVAEGRLASRANVGVLAAAVGLGSIVGALATSALISRQPLARLGSAGVIALTVPTIIVAGSSSPVMVAAALTVIGCGQAAILVSGTVALQRWAPTDVLARIFGVHEASQMLAMACGATALSALADRMSLETTAIVLVAGVLVVSGIAIWLLISSGVDVPPPPAAIVDRIHADPIFAPLGVRAMERLALDATTMQVAPGVAVIVEGEPGDRYYLVVEGRLKVSTGGQVIRTPGAGAAFGEIALLRGIPRTATVTTIDPCVLIAITRESFLESVTGHPQSTSIADSVVADYDWP